MGFTLQSDPERRVVLVTLGKVVTEDSALAAYTAVERFIAANGPHSGITDLSGVEKLLVSRSFVWCLAERPPMIPDGMARVVVAPRPAIYGVSRMLQIIRDNRNGYLEIVRSLDEAFNLLRLESPRFRMIDSDQPLRLATVKHAAVKNMGKVRQGRGVLDTDGSCSGTLPGAAGAV